MKWLNLGRYGLLKMSALAVVVIVAGALAASFLLAPPAAMSLPPMAIVNGTVPKQFSNISTLNGSQASVLIATVLQRQISGIRVLSVNYQGRAYGRLGSIASITTPVLLSYMKYGNNFTITANLTSLPIIGAAVFQLLNRTSGASLCSNVNLTALQKGNYLGALGSGRMVCVPASSYIPNPQQVQYFSPSLLSQYGLSVNYTSVYHSRWNGMGCTYLAGNAFQPSAGGSGQFSMCLSDSLSIPLTLFLSLKNQQGSGYIILNETSISNYSSS